jgi:hypothetical protein
MMLLVQAAAQAIETGRSSSIFLDAGTIGLILTNSGLLIKALLDRKVIKAALDTAALAVKREKDADADATEKPCINHGDRLVVLERSVTPQRLATLEANYITIKEGVDELRRENREDHGKIFDAINSLRDGK